jgi:NAD(P)-dependent dehydrogenase (short-subunit alcohol dehydrogenase family)
VEQKIAIVTGGSSGIGAASAKILCDRGYLVTVVGRDIQRLEHVSAQLPGSDWIAGDLANPEVNNDVVREVVNRRGRIDLLVNSAGTLGPTISFEELSIDDWSSVFSTNLWGPIAATQAAVPYLKASRGSIVSVSSVNAIVAEPNLAPYGVSKAALASFTKFAAADLASYGIRVNCVLPGWVRTPFIAEELEAAGIDGNEISTNLMGRMAEPEEIGQVVAFLASEDASFMTGECVVVDGGHIVFSRDFGPKTQ